MANEEAPKLHIDSDWKAEAQAEKARLAEKSEQDQAKREAAGAGRGLPEANFHGLVSILASQAIMGLGTMVDPETQGVVIDLEGSRFAIDLLTVVQEKTKGNLEKEEEDELNQLVTELRSRFVQVTHLVAEQAKSGNVTSMPAPGGAGGAPGIISPS